MSGAILLLPPICLQSVHRDNPTLDFNNRRQCIYFTQKSLDMNGTIKFANLQTYSLLYTNYGVRFLGKLITVLAGRMR
jgi:hypothetical protein